MNNKDLIHYIVIMVITLLCSVSISCSSDDDKSNEDNVLAGRKIVKLLFIQKEYTGTFSFSYDTSGKISQISDYYDNHISYFYAGEAISWSCGEGTFVAYLADGKAKNMSMQESSFTYDSKGRISELNTKEWDQILRITWDGHNISKIERFEYDGTLIEKTEYSYTNHKAYMLSYLNYFNPFTEFDFLDCLYEAALFYTGACGVLSQNLPDKAKFWNKYYGEAIRTYKYQLDSFGYPVSVSIDGEGYDYDFYGYPVNIAITWE